MRLRMFTDAGLDAAVLVLADLRAGNCESADGLLNDESCTVDLGVRFTKPDLAEVPTRFKLALWLSQLLDSSKLERTLLVQPGLWTWLSLCLIDVLAPITSSRRKWMADDARYLFRRGDFRKSYRHLLAGPYFMARAHLDSIDALRAVLATPPSAPGELYEQLSSRQPIFMSAGALEASSRMFWDPSTSNLKRGVSTAGAGGARRLADVLMQLDVTHDLVECEADYLLQLLPREFARWQRG